MRVLPVENNKERGFDSMVSGSETGAEFEDAGWGSPAARQYDAATQLVPAAKAYVNRGSFELPADLSAAQVTFFYQAIGQQQSIYVNGHALAQNLTAEQATALGYKLDKSWLKPGLNSLVVVSTPFVKKQTWDIFNTDPGTVQVITPAAAWRRKAFNGLAQVLVQGTRTPGDITLTATAPGLKASVLKIKVVPAVPRPAL